MSLDRRHFLRHASQAGALAAVGDLAFLHGLQPVGAEEARVGPEHVRFRPEIEPLVRLLEETPRERLLEEVAGRIRGGTGYREILGALMLAGVRNVQPRPVGFKFHAVLVVHSAHLASVASPEGERWLPLFWALDYFKSAQAQDVREGDWTMAALPEERLPPEGEARSRFVRAMDRWDEPAADAAVSRLARVERPEAVFELFWRYGARDFRDIGHKAIYVANAWRTLQVIGWEHSEPIVRSLAYALLMRGRVNPAEADEPADRPWRGNLERVRCVREGWKDGKPDAGATKELLATMRSGSPQDASDRVVALLNRGVAADSLWDGVLAGAGELIMRSPGILGIHAVTSANALRYAWGATASDETRLLMLLQGAAFMPMFRASMGQLSPALVDRMEPLELRATGPAAVEEIYAAVAGNRMDAARKTLAYLQGGGSVDELLSAGRRLIFLKGTNSHDYKFSSAALEDYAHLRPEWRARYLATSMFNLRGSTERENPLVARTRAAFG